MPTVLTSDKAFTDQRTGVKYSGVDMYRLIALKHALKLECMGLKSRHRVADQIREILGSKTRNKAKLLEEFTARLDALQANIV